MTLTPCGLCRRVLHETVNKFFYGNLIDERKNVDNKYNQYDNIGPINGKRVVLVDTSEGAPFMGYENPSLKNRGARFNLYHATVIRNIVDKWIEKYDISPEQIGVITPYRLQAEFIHKQCPWGIVMVTEIIIDHWNPDKKKWRYETHCYGPRDCPNYRPGKQRIVPGRKP